MMARILLSLGAPEVADCHSDEEAGEPHNLVVEYL
jgi:hypothetical protein